MLVWTKELWTSFWNVEWITVWDTQCCSFVQETNLFRGLRRGWRHGSWVKTTCSPRRHRWSLPATMSSSHMATSSSLPLTPVSGCLRLSSGISGYQHICDTYTYIHTCIYTHTHKIISSTGWTNSVTTLFFLQLGLHMCLLVFPNSTLYICKLMWELSNWLLMNTPSFPHFSFSAWTVNSKSSFVLLSVRRH